MVKKTHICKLVWDTINLMAYKWLAIVFEVLQSMKKATKNFTT